MKTTATLPALALLGVAAAQNSTNVTVSPRLGWIGIYTDFRSASNGGRNRSESLRLQPTQHHCKRRGHDHVHFLGTVSRLYHLILLSFLIA